MVQDTAFNRKLHKVGDEATILIETLSRRSILHQFQGEPSVVTPANASAQTGGAAWAVTWTTTCRLGGNVDLVYSINGGLHWTTLEDGAADNGAWATGNMPGAANTVILRIQMSEDNTIFDEIYFTTT